MLRNIFKGIKSWKKNLFFDVRETKAGDYYLTITESKKFTNEDGTFFYKKHKIYLYKEDFSEFNSSLKETCDFIIENKGEEVISEKHDKDFDKKKKLRLNLNLLRKRMKRRGERFC